MKLNPQQQMLQERLGLVHWRLRVDGDVMVEPQTLAVEALAPLISPPSVGSLQQEPRLTAEEHTPAIQHAEAQSVTVRTEQVPVPAAENPVKPQASAPAVPVPVRAEVAAPRAGTQAQPCRLIWGGAEDALRQRLQADLVTLFERHGCDWQSFQEQPGLTLPPAPCLCFVLQRGAAHIDDAGRLMLPQQPGTLPALEWKPQLWAYLQNIFDQTTVTQHQQRTK